MTSIMVRSPGVKGYSSPLLKEWLNESGVRPAQSLRSPPPVPLKVLMLVWPLSIEK